MRSLTNTGTVVYKMKFLSCLFGQGARCRQPVQALGIQEPSPCPAVVSAGGESNENAVCSGPLPAPEAARPSKGEHLIIPRDIKPSPSHDNSSDLVHGRSPPISRKTSLAAQLLDGLTFSTQVLGIGSYGIVLQGTFDGVEAAVKFMVSSRCTDRAAVQEVMLGAMPTLTHPHVCRTYDTRGATMTDALFDELEAHRVWHQQRLERQRRLRQQQPSGATGGGGTTDGGNGSQLSSEDGCQRSRSGRRTSQGRRPQPRLLNAAGKRVLQFFQDRHATSNHVQRDKLLPLESSAPFAVLHEVLYRLGAVVGQMVTLVVMELCSKGTLSRAIHRGIFEPCDMWGLHVARRALVRTAAEIVRALLHLHKSGVVHGDLKPGNILLKSHRGDRRGFLAKIGDFGLSHLLPAGEKSLDTETWGTPAYMAPEALLGHASTASDVWSFGVILSEALTRQKPYVGFIEPARMVVGILDGTLELTWPTLRDVGVNNYNNCDTTTESGAQMGAVARLARQYGLVFPATTVRNAVTATATGTGTDTAASSLMGILDSTDDGTNAGTTPTTAATTSVATSAMLPTMMGNDDDAGGSGSVTASGDSTAGGGGSGGAEDDLERVLGCLVNLGRRCTRRNPADRPCCSEILGELIDMEIILKTPRTGTVPQRVGRGGGGREAHDVALQDITSRFRSRLGLTVPAVALAVDKTQGGEAAVAAEGLQLAVKGSDGGIGIGIVRRCNSQVPEGGPAGGTVRVNQPNGSTATAMTPALEPTAAAAAAVGELPLRPPPRQRDMVEEFKEMVVSYQHQYLAVQQARAAKWAAEGGRARQQVMALLPPLPVLPLSPSTESAVPAAPNPPPMAAAVTTVAVMPSSPPGEVAEAAAQKVLHWQRSGDILGTQVLPLPERDPSFAPEQPLEQPQPLTSSPLSSSPQPSTEIQILPLLSPHLPTVRAASAAQDGGNAESDDRPMGPSDRAPGAIVTGPGPVTPEVSESCCIVSKRFLEPII